MASSALPAPAPTGAWRDAVVRAADPATPRGVRLRLDIDDRIDHLPGQHYVVRLTAPDGYVAQRSYSIVSAPSDPLLELFVERLDDGEVSPFLADVVRPGDRLRVRGPIGGWFVWRGDGPAVAVAGGSGVVPLVSMLRHAADLGATDRLHLVVAARSAAELPYADELRDSGAVLAFSRESVVTRPAGRLSPTDLDGFVPGPAGTQYFVCGSAGFAESASTLLTAAGAPVAAIRVERFGASG